MRRHGRPHDERQAWDHGLPSWEEQNALVDQQSRRIALVGWALVLLILGYLAWQGDNRLINGALYWVYERVIQ